MPATPAISTEHVSQMAPTHVIPKELAPRMILTPVVPTERVPRLALTPVTPTERAPETALTTVIPTEGRPKAGRSGGVNPRTGIPHHSQPDAEAMLCSTIYDRGHAQFVMPAKVGFAHADSILPLALDFRGLI